MSSVRTWRRRNYFVKQELQGRYILKVFILVILGSVGYAVVLGLLSADTFSVVYDNHRVTVDRTPIALFRRVLGAQWIFVILSGLFVGLAAMFLTHRFAGPLFRFEKTLQEMIGGNLSAKIVLRKHDEGKEVAALFNEFNDELSDRLREIRALSRELQACLLQATEAQPGSPEQGELLRNAQKLNTRIDTMVRGFRLDHD